MPPANVVLFARCSFISSASLPHSNNDNDCKEVRQNLMRLFYTQEMNLQKLFDLASVLFYNYNSTTDTYHPEVIAKGKKVCVK